MADVNSTSTPTWAALIDAPGSTDHIVQLYTDDDFLARTVTQWVGTGFAGGEAAVLIATPAHIALFTERLAGAPAALERGQLDVVDAEDCLKSFLVDGMPNRFSFVQVVGGILDRVRASGYRKIRLYGEMVDLLWQQNRLPCAIRLEALWNELLREQRLPLLCAYRIDTFDRHAQRSTLAPIGAAHSHMIPVEHYERFDRAVGRAYTDVFGEDGDAQTLRDLIVATFKPGPDMPRAQAALLALQDVNAYTADAVLERAKQYYSQGD